MRCQQASPFRNLHLPAQRCRAPDAAWSATFVYSPPTNWRELLPALPFKIEDAYAWVEANRTIAYPALVGVTLALIVAGVLQQLRRFDMDGIQKSRVKAELINELRIQVVGVTADELARKVGLEKFKTVRLLEEMQVDGILFSYNNTERRQVWKLRGIGGAEKPSRSRLRRPGRGRCAAPRCSRGLTADRSAPRSLRALGRRNGAAAAPAEPERPGLSGRCGPPSLPRGASGHGPDLGHDRRRVGRAGLDQGEEAVLDAAARRAGRGAAEGVADSTGLPKTRVPSFAELSSGIVPPCSPSSIGRTSSGASPACQAKWKQSESGFCGWLKSQAGHLGAGRIPVPRERCCRCGPRWAPWWTRRGGRCAPPAPPPDSGSARRRSPGCRRRRCWPGSPVLRPWDWGRGCRRSAWR